VVVGSRHPLTATIIVTMPSPSFSSNNNVAVEVIDPLFLKESNFLSLVDDKHVFSSHCESLKEQHEGFFSFQDECF
jgi:hypothetical protein